MNRQSALEVLDGLMLGDGCLHRYWRSAQYTMDQCKHTISINDHLRWLCWLRDNVFITLDVKATVKPYWGTSRGKKYQAAHLWTESSMLLTSKYDEWYTGGEWVKRNNRSACIRNAIKAIPLRLMNTSILPICTLVHWFLGDGGSSWEYLENPVPLVRISFSTHCYTEAEVYHLRNMLNNIGIKTCKLYQQTHKSGSGLLIYLAQESINDFMHLVESHIMEIFGNSVSPSYKDMVKYRHTALEKQTLDEISRLRSMLK